jgi:acylphosphatase
MPQDATCCVKVLIRGRVQGVGYRFWTKRQAQVHGLCGWVKNLPDGSVQALFQGTRKNVELMLDACRSGPSGAQVNSVDVAPEDFREEIVDFQIAK